MMLEKRSSTAQFSGKRVLVVESEYFLAEETRNRLRSLGAIVVGPTGEIGEALALIIQQEVDAAILDIVLDGHLIFPLAEKLEELAIPYVFATTERPCLMQANVIGYVLSERTRDLEAIAEALFEQNNKKNH